MNISRSLGKKNNTVNNILIYLKVCLLIFICIVISMQTLQIYRNHPKQASEAMLPGNTYFASIHSLNSNSRPLENENILGHNQIKMVSSDSDISSSTSQTDRAGDENNSLINLSKSSFSVILFSVKKLFLSGHQYFLQQEELVRLGIMGYLPVSWINLWWAMVWGGKQLLDYQQKKDFKVIGMQHVAVASGYNVALVTELSKGLVSRFSRLGRVLIWSFLIICYVLATDISPSVMRAGTMAISAHLIQSGLGKQISSLRLLMFSCVFLVCMKPDIAMDLGFQLSVLATLGICLFGKYSKGALAETVLPQLFTLPLILYSFGQLSFLSFVANPTLLWLTPLITKLGFIAFLFIRASQATALFEREVVVLTALIAAPLLGLFMGGVSFFATFSDTLLTGITLPIQWLCGWYLLLLATKWWWQLRTKPRRIGPLCSK